MRHRTSSRAAAGGLASALLASAGQMVSRRGVRARVHWYVLACVLLAGCSGRREALPGEGDADRAAAQANRAIPVAAVRAAARTIPRTLPATGAFAAKLASEVAPAAAGRVAATPLEVGDFVLAGDVLVRLEDRDARLRLEQAQAGEQRAAAALREAQTRVRAASGPGNDPARVPEAQAAFANYQAALARLELAEANARRYGELVDTGDVSRSAYQEQATQAETARAEADALRRQYEAALNAARQGFAAVSAAEAALAGARAETGLVRKALADTVVRAPFAGYLTARPVSAGEYVGAAESVATVTQVQPIDLALQVPEAASGETVLGLGVRARVAAYPDRTFRGAVTTINPAVNEQSRAFTLTATFENGDRALRPGMFATAEILLPSQEQAVFIPRAALVEDPETASWHVYVVANGVARLRVVQAGAADGDQVRIVSGLAGGEVVAVSNLRQLFDGAPVEVRPGA